MHVEKILHQHKRDTRLLVKCQHCAVRREIDGFDDANFYHNVLPSMKCHKCGKACEGEYEAPTPTYKEFA